MKYWNQRFAQEGPMGTVSLKGADARMYWSQAGWIYEAVRSYLPKTCSLAYEIGCGAGRMVPYIMRHAQRYFGVDVVPGLVDLARLSFEAMTVDFHTYSKNKGLPSFQRVGLVWFSTVMQHITCNGDLRAVLVAMRQMAEPECILVGYEALTDWENKTHIKFRSLEEVRGLLTETGWNLVAHKECPVDNGHVAFKATVL